jgi:hypothetical protein
MEVKPYTSYYPLVLHTKQITNPNYAKMKHLRFVNTKVIQALNELPITFPLQKQKLKGA